MHIMPLVCTVNYGEHSMFGDFSGASGIGTSPFKAGSTGSMPRFSPPGSIPRAWWPKNQHIEKKKKKNKFNKDNKMVHIKKNF